MFTDIYREIATAYSAAAAKAPGLKARFEAARLHRWQISPACR
jgi:hypothetical protein